MPLFLGPHLNVLLAVVTTAALASVVATPGPGALRSGEEYTAPFAAEVLNVHGTTVERSRVNVANGKIRAEAIEGGDPKHGIAILDYPAGTIISINPQDRTYIDMRDLVGPFASQFARLYRVAQPLDPANPCAEMQLMVSRVDHLTKAGADSAHIECAPLGRDTVDGRDAQKWRVMSTRAQRRDTAIMWVDSRLRFITKSVDSGSASEVLKIQEGPQPPELFEVPAGYKKLSVGKVLAGLKGHGLLDILGNAAKDAAAQEAEDQTRNAAKKVIRGILGQP